MKAQHETTDRMNGRLTMRMTNEVKTMPRINTRGWTGRRGIGGTVVVLVAVAAFVFSARQPQAVAAPSTNLSAIPRGLADYQGVHTLAAPSTNFSTIPLGLMDYQGLHTLTAPSTNFSTIPLGLADYQGLHTVAAPSANFSRLPRGWTDYHH